MKVEIVDMNLQENEDLWDNEWNKGLCSCYVYSFPDAYMQHHDSDAYVFLFDDGKDKHESYEAHLRMPYWTMDDERRQVEASFYGADRDEAIHKLNEWLNKQVEFVTELKESVCETSSELPAE